MNSIVVPPYMIYCKLTSTSTKRNRKAAFKVNPAMARTRCMK